MHLTPRFIIETIAAIGTICCLGFYVLSLYGITSFFRARRQHDREAPRSFLPSVSILKPLKGIDPHIRDAFRSHCEQDYPEYELIFGVSDPEDPAIVFVRELQREYPQRRIELVIGSRDLGTNRKVSTLAQMLPAARQDVLIVNDSDILVEPDYLRRVVAPLHDPSVGMVTCLYRGVPAPTLGSKMEALGISTDFIPGVLSARIVEGGIHFGLGSTMAFRRPDLQAIGGFESILDYLADDYELGNRISALGKRVELSEVVVATFLPAYSARQFFDHQLRWARSVRGSRSWGYTGLVLTFGVPWALGTVLAARGSIASWILLAVTLAARVAVALGSGIGVLRDRRVLTSLYLLPLRDLIAPVVWIIGLVGNRISWRGDVFYLEKGRLVRKVPGDSAPRELSNPSRL